ncbi:MAG: VOC family protein [Sphingobacteriales bacterium]|nr:MAG: VOC family protein [Sphingobacteriales bacterium]
MSVHIPSGMNQVMPYLIVKGAAQLQEFMTVVFGAREHSMHADEDGNIMHAQVLIGESLIMFSDARGEFEPMTAGMFIYVEDADASYHKAIEAGGTTIMPLSDQEYGRTCGVMDPTGNTWWITSVKSGDAAQ